MTGVDNPESSLNLLTYNTGIMLPENETRVKDTVSTPSLKSGIVDWYKGDVEGLLRVNYNGLLLEIEPKSNPQFVSYDYKAVVVERGLQKFAERYYVKLNDPTADLAFKHSQAGFILHSVNGIKVKPNIDGVRATAELDAAVVESINGQGEP